MSELYPALVKAMAEIGGATKDKVNPHFKSKYADLESVIDAVKAPLAKHGLCFLQRMHEREGGVACETLIIHSSGESVSTGIVYVPASKQDPQGYGSAITYAKRYSLQTGCGVPSADDDGNAASKPANIINPVKEAIQGIDIDWEKANKIASSLIDLHNAFIGDLMPDADYRAYELVEPMDSDMKLAVWEILKTHSKVRSWLKKIGEEHKGKTQ